MDPFWCITLSVITVSTVFKRERNKRKEKKAELEKIDRRIEAEKEQAVIEQYRAVFSVPETVEEKEARKAAKQAQEQHDKDVAELRKQGFTDELIATIIPTINNGQ